MENKQLLGHYINSIKKKLYSNEDCALSFFLRISWEKNLIIEDSFFTEGTWCDDLIASFEKNKNWDDVLRFCGVKI